MDLTSEEALLLIEKYKTKENEQIINHSICVANCASKIAASLNLDIDKVKTLGYIHDIGKLIDITKEHSICGYEFLKKIGYKEDYANICITHSYLNNDYFCIAGEIPKDIEFRTYFIKNHKYTIYEKIINISDLMCTTKILTLDKRLIELMLRKGIFENTLYHVKESYKLKQYFDDLLGFNLYNLFDNIEI